MCVLKDGMKTQELFERAALPSASRFRSTQNSHSRAQNRLSNSRVFNQMQRSAQLIENRRYQNAYFHTHAHSFPVTPVVATLTQNIPGVWVPFAISKSKGPLEILSPVSHNKRVVSHLRKFSLFAGSSAPAEQV
jgi:hypothetical protein